MDKLEPFQSGVDKQREHLNKMIDMLNDHEARIKAEEDLPTITLVAHNAENTRLVRVEVKSALIIEDLGEISCDCVSGESHGDA